MKQITEDYVSYEIAVLLKEKGFDECVYTCYTVDDYPLFMTMIDYVVQDEIYERIGNDCHIIQAPTHQMALKWMREVHKIVLDIVFEANKGWTFYVSRLITETLSDGSTRIVDIQYSVRSDDVQQPYYKEYEEAGEASILYVLKNLI